MKVQPDDLLCVYMKNIAPNPSGVYIVGNIKEVGLRDGGFLWGVDRSRSVSVVASPIRKSVLEKYFPRIYGGSMQPLAAKHHRPWLSMLGRGYGVFRDTPVINVQGTKRATPAQQTARDPLVNRENGLRGERHVLALLKKEYPSGAGYKVEHVAAKNSGADHDIAVLKNRKTVQFVEVKTRVGRPNDPVIISEREIECRNRNRGKHTIFVVYLDGSGAVHSTLRVGDKDGFRLGPRQHWLHPQAE
jgi:hypothetical protein